MRKQLAAIAARALAITTVLWAAPGSADPLSELSIDRLASGALELRGVQAHLRHAGQGAELSLRITRVRAGEWQLDGLSWRCTLQTGSSAPRCSGPLRWKGGPKGSLSVTREGGWSARWRSGDVRIDGAADAALQALDLSWQQLPLAWFSGQASGVLPEGLSITAGLSSGEARGDAGLSAWQGRVALQGAALDSADGLTAAAGVDAELGLDWRDGDAPRIALQADVSAGELLYQQLYVPLAADSRIEWALVRGDEGWSPAGPLRMVDGEGADFSLALKPGADASLTWHLSARFADLARSGPRYLDGPLSAAGFAAAAFSGSAEADLSGVDGSLQYVSLKAREVTFADPQGVVVLSGLSGGLEWRTEGVSPASRLAWQALSLQGIALGPASLAGVSRDGVFEASEPLAFAPFGGTLVLFPLRIRPLESSADFEARMDDIRLAALSAQLGWPAFEGRISGSLPAASYRNHVLASEGSLDIAVFDGRVQVRSLRWERPFGVAPSIAAEIELDDLDLQPLTGAFGFGSISGRLDGYVHGLRVLDGSPVSFDAFLHTDDAFKGRRRISQRAVNSIGSVGGGAAAGLQQTVLSLFDTFGYRRIGLRCRLANNVCEMGGVEDLDNGYVLIEGAGLPRVTVNGYRRRVDWPVLLARLQAAADGGRISVD